jgi:hypothetical protein
MNVDLRRLRALAVAPVFLFAMGSLLLGVAGWSPLALLVAIVVGLPLFAAAWPDRLPWLLAPSMGLFLLVAVVTWFAQSVPTGAGGDLIAGTLLGLPMWFLGITLGTPERPGISLLALEAGLLESVASFAALATLPTPPAPSQYEFLNAWFLTDGHHLGALASALTGGGLVGGASFPLASYSDPVFVALAFLAVGGLLLPLLRSENPPAVGVPRPPRRDLAATVRRVPPPILYAEALPPTASRPPPGAGLLPVAGAVAAVVGFEAVGIAAPSYTFTIVTAAAIAAVLFLALLVRSRTPRRRLKIVPSLAKRTTAPAKVAGPPSA